MLQFSEGTDDENAHMHTEAETWIDVPKTSGVILPAQ